ncbi:hypothetical protein YPPY61_2921, partial [Yersinia pestis PY-61]
MTHFHFRPDSCN